MSHAEARARAVAGRRADGRPIATIGHSRGPSATSSTPPAPRSGRPRQLARPLTCSREASEPAVARTTGSCRLVSSGGFSHTPIAPASTRAGTPQSAAIARCGAWTGRSRACVSACEGTGVELFGTGQIRDGSHVYYQPRLLRERQRRNPLHSRGWCISRTAPRALGRHEYSALRVTGRAQSRGAPPDMSTINPSAERSRPRAR